MPIHGDGSSLVTLTSAAAVGSGVAQAPVTLAAICRATDFGNWRPVYGTNGSTFFLTSGGGAIRYEENGTNSDSPVIRVTANEWVVIAITKAAGTVAPRFHHYRYSNNTWAHENAGAATAAANHTGANIFVGGQPAYTNFWLGEIEVIGHWKRVLTDAEIENLPFSLQAWYAAQPNILMKCDNGSRLVDLRQDATFSSADAGVTASTVSVPVFNYGDGIWVPVRPVVVAGGTSVSFSDSGTGTDALTEIASLTAADSGTGADALTEIASLSAADSGSGSDTITPKASAPLADTGAGTDTISASAALTAADSGSGTDTLSESAKLSVADSGSGADSFSVIAAGAPVFAETGTGTDGFSVKVTVAISDSASGVDSFSPVAHPSIADSGTSTDVISAIGYPTITEVASGSDSFAVPIVSITVSDSATAIENFNIAATFSFADAAVGVDSARSVFGIFLTGTEEEGIMSAKISEPKLLNAETDPDKPTITDARIGY
jgi:hypothetical protein